MRDPAEPARNVERPEAGYFELRLVRGGPLVAARITVQDGLWRAEIDGEWVGPADADPALAAGVFRLWHGANRIDQSVYNFRLATKAWARDHQPEHAALRPRKRIDLATAPSVF